jgi:hypothetical protein
MLDDKNKQLEEEFDSFFDLFRNDGYKRLIEQLSTQLSLIDNLMDTKDLDDLRIRQGQMSVLKQLIDFENTTRNEYEQWLEEQSTQTMYD